MSAYNDILFQLFTFFMTEPVRLAKRLVELVACSRREAELYIAGGWVMVDGEVVEEPQFMVSNQLIELHPNANLVPIEPVTLLFHHLQAPDTNSAAICADTRAADDHSGIHLLRQHFFKLTPCTPLERNASGLTVYTQDFRIIRKLKDDAATIEQEYIVEVAGEIMADGLTRLNHGLKFNGKPLPPIKVSWQNETRLRFALKGVIPGQIAAMCEKVGLEVISMKRIRIGRVSMAKLQAGQWRYLMQHERF
ncbi:MAG: rRNA pseudouridine synthase [Nitrosomonadales bacterium]